MTRDASISLILHIIALMVVMFLAPSCVMESSQDALFDARQMVRGNLETSVLLYLDAALKKEAAR